MNGGGKSFVAFYKPILPNLHDLRPLQLVPNLVTLAQSFGSASAWQTRCLGFEPVLMR